MARRYKQTITFAIDPDLLKKINRTSKAMQISRSAFICAMLENGLGEAELHAKLLGDKAVMQAFSNAMSAPGVMSSLAAAMSAEISDDQQRQLRQLLEGLGQIPD